METEPKRTKSSSSQRVSIPAGSETEIKALTKRLQPPLARHRPVLPLAPKPQPPLRKYIKQESSQALVSTAALPGPCGIPACKRLSCLLVSHHQYAKQFIQGQGSTTSPAQATSTSQNDSEFALSTVTPVPKNPTIPMLPLHGMEALQPELRRLFQDFFTNIVRRVYLLVVPPTPGFSEWMEQRKRSMFERSVTSPLVCLNYIATAYNVRYARGDSHQEDHAAIGISIQSHLMKELRGALEHYEPTKDAETVLSVIFTIVIADVTAGREESLLAHRKAMKRIVDSCGGLHKTGNAMPFAAQLDKVLAVHTDSAPLYTTWLQTNVALQRAPRYPAIYGAFFEPNSETDIRAASLDQDIMQYCVETCRAIEILEGEKWDFTGNKLTPISAEIYYLYYLRDRLTGRFAHLNAKFLNDTSHQRCILLAAKIVEYSVLSDNITPNFPLKMANELRLILVEQDVDEKWVGWRDVLLWISFVLICMPSRWNGRDWAYVLCRGTLRRLYGDDSAKLEDWKGKVSMVLKNFAWSSTRLDKAFDVCYAQLIGVDAKQDES